MGNAVRSSVEIHNIVTGETRVVWQTERLVEAPNFSRDGSFLIVNGDGLLYRLPLDGGRPVKIDTGFATRCNNDHGISPDGALIAISDKVEFGKSAIYLLPSEGGTPRLATPNLPSYWHGWSPDGRTLAYVAKRGDAFQIYTCPAEGGDEMCLTQGFDHCDGPDYTSDGAWIWFNGEKDGHVDLWRIRPDGSGSEKMTGDERVDWFPHPSPDGRHVLYLAYERGVKGHPRGKHVELRLLPAEGGETRSLLSLFGGQGTINVPCWAPDSRQFAFVKFLE